MTNKEKKELNNLRMRVYEQRLEIKRLTGVNDELKGDMKAMMGQVREFVEDVDFYIRREKNGKTVAEALPLYDGWIAQVLAGDELVFDTKEDAENCVY